MGVTWLRARHQNVGDRRTWTSSFSPSSLKWLKTKNWKTQGNGRSLLAVDDSFPESPTEEGQPRGVSDQEPPLWTRHWWEAKWLCWDTDLPWWLSSKESSCSTGDEGSILWRSGGPLEKEMATHSRILTWKVPWTEEPGGLQSVGSWESGAT